MPRRPNSSGFGPRPGDRPNAGQPFRTPGSSVGKKIGLGVLGALFLGGYGFLADTLGIGGFFGLGEQDQAAPTPTVTVTVTAPAGSPASPAPAPTGRAAYTLAQLKIPFLFAKTDNLTNHEYDLDTIKKQAPGAPKNATDLSYRDYGKSAHLEPWNDAKAAMGRALDKSPTAESCLNDVERNGIEEWNPYEGAAGDGLCFVTSEGNVAYIEITAVQKPNPVENISPGPEIKATVTLWKRNG